MICMIDGPSDRCRVTMNYACCSHLVIVHIAEHYPGNEIKVIDQVQFLITQLIISTHFDVSTAIGGLLQELIVQWSLLARWRGEQ